jgi:hypothetical protein
MCHFLLKAVGYRWLWKCCWLLLGWALLALELVRLVLGWALLAFKVLLALELGWLAWGQVLPACWLWNLGTGASSLLALELGWLMVMGRAPLLASAGFGTGLVGLGTGASGLLALELGWLMVMGRAPLLASAGFGTGLVGLGTGASGLVDGDGTGATAGFGRIIINNIIYIITIL